MSRPFPSSSDAVDGRVLNTGWSGAPWRWWRLPLFWGATAHLGLDLIVVLLATVLVVLLTVSVALLPALLIGLPLVVVLLRLFNGAAAIERSRFAVTVGVLVLEPRRQLPNPAAGMLRRSFARLADRSAWRAALYFLVLLPLGTVAFSVLATCWAAVLALVTLPLYVSSLPSGSADLWLVDIHSVGPALVVAAIALAAGWVVLPLVTWALISTEVAVGRALLGPGRSAALTERVGVLTESRSRVVDSAEQERRRMERDLHDGAQQRLVAMSMTVGRLSSRLRKAGDDEALALADQAQSEVRLAIAELRDLTRGLHPPVLTDRGLDAALSAVAARCPIPVSVSVELAVRPSLTLESIAYFFVSEALTNVAKHAAANSAAVQIEATGNTLLATVTDDGVGGAVASPGSGLAGLADRAAGVDGRLLITSPLGGPTTLQMELPCAW